MNDKPKQPKTRYLVLRLDMRELAEDWWSPIRHEPTKEGELGELRTFPASNGSAAIGMALEEYPELEGVLRAVPLHNWGVAEKHERVVRYRRKKLPGL